MQLSPLSRGDYTRVLLITLMDKDLLLDMDLVPYHLLCEKQRNRDEARSNALILRDQGHLVIDDMHDCDIIIGCHIDDYSIAERYGYASEPGLEVYLGPDYSWQHQGEIEPIYLCPWLTK